MANSYFNDSETESERIKRKQRAFDLWVDTYKDVVPYCSYDRVRVICEVDVVDIGESAADKYRRASGR